MEKVPPWQWVEPNLLIKLVFEVQTHLYFSCAGDVNFALFQYNKINVNIHESSAYLMKNKSSFIFSNTSSRFEVGKALIEEGDWYVKRFGGVALSLPIDWSMNPFRERSWIWLLHQFDFFRDAIAYEKVNGGRAGYDFCLKAAFSWWKEFYDRANSPSFAWHDHGSANRAINVVNLRDAFLKANLRISERTEKFFVEFVSAHAHFLADEREYSAGTNHGLEQSIALFAIALANTDQIWSKEYLPLAVSRIEAELKRGFKEDGGHIENSVNYQDFGIRQIVKSFRILKKYPSFDKKKLVEIREMLDRSSRVLSHMIAPNGRFPMIGDTEYLEYPNILASVAELPSYEGYLYARSGGREGSPPVAPDLILQKSGWAAFRSGWRDENDLHLLTKCAFLSRYHRHDDDTSFVLHALGEEWITDGGLYKYEEKDPMRIHLRSHYAHSLTAPDGIEPIRNLRTSGGRNRIEDFATQSDVAWVQMVSRMFPGYISKRKITLERPGLAVTISDQLAPLEGVDVSSSCTTRFLVPKDKSVNVEGADVRIQGARSSLLISPDRKPDSIRVLSAQTEPELRGWQSRSFNTIDPAHTIEFQYDGGNLSVEYRLTFS